MSRQKVFLFFQSRENSRLKDRPIFHLEYALCFPLTFAADRLELTRIIAETRHCRTRIHTDARGFNPCASVKI